MREGESLRQLLAEAFCEDMEIDDHVTQGYVMFEEVGELAEAISEDDDEKIREELADIVIVAEVLAVIKDIDLDDAYIEKMVYNLKKSGDRNGSKVADDVCDTSRQQVSAWDIGTGTEDGLPRWKKDQSDGDVVR